MEAKRLMQHMPKYYRVISEIIVLQKAIQIELDEVDLISQDILNQFFIYTATWSLPIWERIFGLPVGDKTSNIQERRESLISKLRSYGTTTKEMIARVGNSFTNGGVKIIEDNTNYSFVIEFTSVVGLPKNMEDFIETIEIIKPAHLSYTFKFRYNQHKQVAFKKHEDLKTKTHEQVYNTRLYEDLEVLGKYHTNDKLVRFTNADLGAKTHLEIYEERR